MEVRGLPWVLNFCVLWLALTPLPERRLACLNRETDMYPFQRSKFEMSLDTCQRERLRLKPQFLLHEAVSSLVFPWQWLFWDHRKFHQDNLCYMWRKHGTLELGKDKTWIWFPFISCMTLGKLLSTLSLNFLIWRKPKRTSCLPHWLWDS